MLFKRMYADVKRPKNFMRAIIAPTEKKEHAINSGDLRTTISIPHASNAA